MIRLMGGKPYKDENGGDYCVTEKNIGEPIPLKVGDTALLGIPGKEIIIKRIVTDIPHILRNRASVGKMLVKINFKYVEAENEQRKQTPDE